MFNCDQRCQPQNWLVFHSLPIWKRQFLEKQHLEHRVACTSPPPPSACSHAWRPTPLLHPCLHTPVPSTAGTITAYRWWSQPSIDLQPTTPIWTPWMRIPPHCPLTRRITQVFDWNHQDFRIRVPQPYYGYSLCSGRTHWNRVSKIFSQGFKGLSNVVIRRMIDRSCSPTSTISRMHQLLAVWNWTHKQSLQGAHSWALDSALG